MCKFACCLYEVSDYVDLQFDYQISQIVGVNSEDENDDNVPDEDKDNEE